MKALRRLAPLALVALLTACGGGAGSPAGPSSPADAAPVPSGPAGFATTPFGGNVVLGSPTATSVRVNVYAADLSGEIAISYGTSPWVYERQTARVALSASQPTEVLIDGLRPDAEYFYRVSYRSSDGAVSASTDEARFHTARPAGSSFTFAVQGDSHPERTNTQFDAELYRRTLLAAAADRPDFYIAMGDDFSVDTLGAATINAAQVTGRYTLQRPYLGLIGRSAPIYLVNGNHEQGARYLLDGGPENVAVWAQNARNRLYPQPAPDGFYSGNGEVVPHIGLLRNYYAWTWGDALFVVIDPYWSSPVAVDNLFGGNDKRSGSPWEVTHGEAQYQWLKATLEASRARYKFVFAHHVMGTGRGGIELAGLWEWGGRNTKGVDEFAAQRPAWALPIHQLMAANRVTIFFQGHDHIWVRQQLDGVIYQTLPEPADPNYALHYADAYASGDKFPNSGYTRVRVTPAGVTVEYVRSFLPKDEGPGRVHGAVAFGYTVP